MPTHQPNNSQKNIANNTTGVLTTVRPFKRATLILAAFVAATILTVTAYMQDPPHVPTDSAPASTGDTKLAPIAVDKSKEAPVEAKIDEPSSFAPNAISATTYPFTSSTGATLEDMSSGTTSLIAPLVFAGVDDDQSVVNNIGFDFWFNGVRYTQFSCNANGQCRLGATIVSQAFTNSIATATDNPKIVPYWDDISIGTNGKVHYKAVGSAPNRKLVVEFQNMNVPRSVGAAGAATFQMWLYETSGKIEFVYGSGLVTNSANSGYTVGFSDSSTVFASVTVSATPTVSYATANNTNTVAITSGTKYTFTPVTPNDPTTLTFTGTKAGSTTLNWTDTSANELGFAIFRSDDGGTTYKFINQAPANATSSLQTGLSASTNYFWRVFAVTEGSLSANAAANSMTTGAAGTGAIVSAGSGNWNSTTVNAPWPGGVVPTASDEVIIADGTTVTVNVTTAGCASLQAGQGTSGILQFDQTTVSTLTVGGDVTISPGGTIRSNTAGAVTTHNLSIGGNLTNNGTLDLSTASNLAGAILTFTGALNNTFSGTGATTDLRTLTINKGNSLASTLEITTSNLTVQGTTTDGTPMAFLTLTNGTLKVSGTFTLTGRVFTAAGYTIGATSGFWANNPNFTISGQNGSPILSGLLRISTGVFNVGSATNSMNMSNGGVFTIEGGTFNTVSRLSIDTSPATAPTTVTYNQSGGTVTVSTAAAGNVSTTLSCFDLGTSAGSSITISAGSIIHQNNGTGASGPRDYRNLAAFQNLTGGTLQLGNASSGAAKTYNIQGFLPNLLITNTSAGHTAVLQNSTFAVLGTTINSGATLNVSNGFTFLQLGSPVLNNGAITGTVASSRFDFIGTAAQTYGGTGTFGTNAAPFGGTGVGVANPANVTLNAPIITTRINLFTGLFINSNQISLGAGGAASVFVQRGGGGGPAGSFDVAPTFNLGTGTYQLSYPAATTLTTTSVEIPATRSITFLTINNINGATLAGGNLTVSGTAAGTLALTNGAFATGSNTLYLSSSAATVTRTTGYVDGNFKKNFSASASKTFEVGTANGYSPVTANVTSGTGDFTVKATQGGASYVSGANKLARFWTLTATGITADLTFTYLAADVTGTVASYQFIKNSSGTLSTLAPAAPPTSTSATINGVSSFSDWTLAEPSAVLPGSLQLSSATYTDSETNADHVFNIPVSRTGGADGNVAVTYTVTDGTATTADNDYVISPASGSLIWNSGDATSKNIAITIKGDTTFEPDETVNVAITSPTNGAALGSPNTAVLTITNDDPNDVTFNASGNLAAGTYNNITINSPAVVTVTGNVVVNGCLNLNSGATLNMGTFTFTGTGCFNTNSGSTLGIGAAAGITTGATGNVQVGGTRTFSSGANYVYNGALNQAVGNALPGSVANLTIANTGGGGNNTVTGNSGQAVTGTLTVQSGVYSSASDYADVAIAPAGTLSLAANITVSGNWTNNGTFTANGFGVTFDGATGQTITGTTSFFNLTKSVAAAQTMNFTTGSNTTVTNSLTLNGAAGQLLSLRSTTAGTQWNLSAPATQAVSYVDAQDSNASGGTTVTPTNSVNSGNNSNWTFAQAAIVYVDPTFTGPNGTDPPGPGTSIGYDAFATIQAGVTNVASGGTVNVAAGTYTENVTIAQPLTLTGAGAASVFVRPATSNPNCGGAGGGSLCAGGSNIILVQASNVTISGMTLDGDNPGLTSAENFGGANIDARNGIITNHLMGVYNNLEVHHTTVKNIWLRGMYASSGGSFNFHDNTVDNVQANVASIGMFNFLGAGAFTNNNVSRCNDGISSNHSRGTTYTGNTVTTSASGIHSDNAGDSGGTNDTISGNTVTNSQVFGYGIWVFVAYKTVHVQNNTVTNTDVGYAVFGDSGSTTSTKPNQAGGVPTPGRTAPKSVNTSEAGPALQRSPAPNAPPSPPYAAQFTGNTVDGQNKANSTGVYFTTSQISFGSGNPKVAFTSNTVVNNVDGFYLEAEDGFTLETAASFNRIVGNTNSQVTQASGAGLAGTLNGSMENNWWGCNAGPNNAGCGTVVGSGVDYDPWFVLSGTATPNSIAPGGTSNVAADMTKNSNGVVPAGTLPDLPIAFSATNGTMNPTSGTVTAGAASSMFTSTNTSSAIATLTVDNQNVNVPITVNSPSFSIDDITLNEGNINTTSFTFTITKTGTTALNASLDYATVDGTAVSTGGTPDFTAIPTTNVVFLPADTTKQVTVLVNGDTAIEPTETFTVHLSNASGATIADADGLGTITNDDACGSYATVYVDDNWVGTISGTDPDAGGPATSFGCDSFATIQGAVNAVQSGGTVNVYDGTYNEDITINNPGITVVGFGPGSKTIVGPIGGPGSTVAIAANNVSVAGFTITRAGNNTTDWNNGGLNSVGISIQGAFSNILIHDNTLTGNRTGIDINNSSGHIVRNNVIDFNRTGMIFRNVTDNMTVVENFITNNWTVGVLFLDASVGSNVPAQTALNSIFSNNNISANWYGQVVDRQTGGSLPAPGANPKNFRGNWYGTTSPVVTTANSTEPGYAGQIPVAYGGSATPPGGQPDIAGPASANIKYIPFLQSGTDTNVETVPGRGTFGFQGVANANIVVRSSNLQGFSQQHSTCGAAGTGSQNFVIGPATPPLQFGSLQYLIGANGDSFETIRTADFNNTRIDALTNLRYGTYVTQAGSGGQAAYLLLNIDFNGDNTLDDQIFFEPVYQSAAFFPANPQGPLVVGAWQQWDALNGGWWSLNNIAGAGPGVNVKSLTQYLAAQPNARVLNTAGGGFRVATGCGAGAWDNFDGNLDDLYVGVSGANSRYDFEPVPRISISDVTQPEGDSGTTLFNFNVTLSHPSDQTITVDYQTADDTAASPTDFSAIPATTLTFNPGVTSLPVTVSVNGDMTFENTEQFFVNLSNVNANGIILDGQGVGTITNDDAQPSFSIDDVTHNEGNGPGTTSYTFTISKTGATAFNSSVDYETVNGSATAPSDFTAITPTNVVFLPADTTRQVTVLVNGDTGFEVDETFTVHLSNAVGGTISDADGTGTITNDDVCGPQSIVYVDDDWAGTPMGDDPDGAGPATNFGCDSFATVQGGVTGVAASGTVMVAAGNYPEQVVIGKSLTLVGAGAATTNITTPGTLTPGLGGNLILVQVNNAAVVEMSNITVKGPRVAGGCSAAIFYGVYVSGGANLNLHDAAVTDIRLSNPALYGCQDGIAIRAGSQALAQTATLMLNHLTITGYQKGAVLLDGTGTTGTVQNSTITGFGPENLAQNAIQIGRSAGATVTGNTITGNECNNPVCGPDPFTQQFGTGLLIFATNATIQVNNNTISNNDTGVYNNAPNTTISGNTMAGNRYNGIFLDEGTATITGNTLSGPMNNGVAVVSFTAADGTTGNSVGSMTQNTITGAANGLALLDADTGDAFEPLLTAHFNRIISTTNAVSRPSLGSQPAAEKAMRRAIREDGAKIEGKMVAEPAIRPSAPSAATNNLENNWWGCNAGPGNAGCGSVTGTAIVDFNPWIVLGVSAVPTSVGSGGTSTVTADMTKNSDGLTPVGGPVPSMPVAWSATNGTMNPTSGTITAGQATSMFTSSNSSSGSACAMVDNQNTCTPITVVPPSFSIDDVTLNEGNAGPTSFTFTITKTGSGAASVDYETVDGSATAPSDYTAIPTTPLSFLSSDTTKQVTVFVNGDMTFEGNQTFTVHLSNAIGGTISDADGTGTILDDDSTMISGRVTYQSGSLGVRTVTMKLEGNNGFVTQTTNTDSNGDYSFTNVPLGNDYTLTPSKSGDVGNLHIESIDASNVARYVTGLDVPTAIQQIAGDADGDSTLTSLDASFIARYVTGSLSDTGIVGTWKFLPPTSSYPNLSGSQMNQNFAAILVGDTDGNWMPTVAPPAGDGNVRAGSSSPASPQVTVSVSLAHVPGVMGSVITVPMTVGDVTGQAVRAYDLQVTFNAAIVKPCVANECGGGPTEKPFDKTSTLSEDMTVTANANNTGHLIISAFQAEDMIGSGTLLKLRFHVVGAQGQNTPLAFEDYTDLNPTFHPGFRFNNGTPQAAASNGSVTVNGPTAGSSRLSGRVTNEAGEPVGGVTITVTGGARPIRTITNRDGYYAVEGLETNGFYTVTPARANFVFAPQQRSFSLIGDRTDAVFTGAGIGSDEANPLESPEFFVRQQYLDFLNREPEQAGLDYWSGQLRSCGSNGECLRQRRLDVSAAFFISQEFSDSGLYLYDLYQGALGRRPDYTEYAADRRLVVGGPHLEADKAAFAAGFVERSEFTTQYPLTMSGEVYVDALLRRAGQTSGLDLNSGRARLLELYQTGATVTEGRSLVLRSVVEAEAFKQTQYNAGFVLSEYFSYLGRNADRAGYEFWLNVLNSGERNNYRGMVCSFVTSTEYQRRFATVIPRSNVECR